MKTSIDKFPTDFIQSLPFGIFLLNSELTVEYWNGQLSEWTGLDSEKITGNKITDYFPWFLEPRIHHKLNDVFVHQKKIVFSSSTHPHLVEAPLDDSNNRYFHTTVSPVNLDDNTTVALFSLQDVTESIKTREENKRLLETIDSIETKRIQTLREREVIQRLSQSLAGLINVKEAGKVLALESRQLFKHDAFVLLVLNETNEELEVVYTEDTPENRPLPIEVEDDSIMNKGLMFQEILDNPYRLINRVKEPVASEYEPFGDTNRLSRSLMFVPVRWQGKPVGILSVQSYTVNKFGIHDIELLKTFAEHCGGVLARLRYENALQESERSLHVMFEGSQDGIVHLGKRSVIHCNQRFADLFGLSIEDCKTTDITQFIHPDDREKMLDYNQRRLQGEPVPRRYEFKIININEHIIHIDGTFDLLKDGDKPCGILGYFRDITNQKMMEDELKASQDLYYSLVQSLPLGIFRKDHEYRYTFVNEKFQEEIGMSESDIIGRTDFHILPSNVAERTWRSDFEVINTMEPIESIEEFQYPGEDPLYYHTIKIPLRDANGEVRGLQGMFWDESDRVRAQEAMTRIYQAIDNSSDAIAVYDHTLRNVYYNKTFLDLFGFTMEELDHIGGVERLYADQDQGHEIHKYLSEGKSWKGELKAITKGGKTLPLALRADAVRDENGAVVGRIGIYRDMTSWKKYESELKKAVHESQTASKAKSEFLANMSHEIRTPMNGIIGMTELALDTKLNPEQREYLELVKDSSESLLELLNDILDFSKVEAGKLELDATVFSLRNFFSKLIQAITYRAEQKNVELIYYIEPNVPDSIIGDPNRIRQILNNLIGNSIKFTEFGEIYINVSLIQKEENNVTLQFDVYDTGIGIPEEKQNKIFEAFEQGDTSTTRQYGGTGLGLAITKRLISLMEGKIGFNSPNHSPNRAEGGDGSHFWFQIPLGLSTEDSVLTYGNQLQGEKVLIVQENQNIKSVLSNYLSSWNLKVETVSSIQDSWKHIQSAQINNDPFSFIIINQNKSTALLESHVDNDSAKVPLPAMLMIMEQSKRDKTVLVTESSSTVHYLVKPITPSDLYNKISSVLYGFDFENAAVDYNNRSGDKHSSNAKALSGTHILLAEDNPVNQKIVLRTLEKLKYKLSVANNGEEAFNLWQNNHFDLILMDVQMPIMDGLQATRKIRGLEKLTNKHIPIIALTAHAMKGDRERCLEAGMDDYLHKPVNPNILKERVATIISSSSELQDHSLGTGI